MEKETSPLEKVGLTVIAVPVAIILFVLAVVPLALIEAFVLVKLWAWFVVPAFGLPPIGYVTAIGIDLVASNFRPLPPHELKDEYVKHPSIWRRFVVLIAVRLMALAFGAILHWGWM